MSVSKYALVDDDLLTQLQDRPNEQHYWLFLESHPEFHGQWIVSSLKGDYFFDLKDIIGPYRAVAPSGLQDFINAATDHGYRVAFFEDPAEILAAYERLNEPPPVELNSSFEGTVHGFLPYQVQGFNFLKDLHGGVAMWSTGTGKTVLASALIEYHFDNGTFDTAFFVAKAHNRINTQRALKRLAGINSVVIDGAKKRRQGLYSQAFEEPGRVLVTNYEKFRADQEQILPFFERRVLVIWDEMPTKLKTRTTKLYTAVCECLYTRKAPQVRADWKRPEDLRQYMLSATPIQKDPEDWFNCVRLIDPPIYGTVKEFRNEYVATYNYFDQNKPERWHKLDKMGLKAAHITHQVDKDDPDIAKQFPKALDEPYYIDWDPADRKVYDKLASYAEDESINVVSVITALQMLCCAPSMLGNSATVYAEFERQVESWIDAGAPGDEEPIRAGSKTALKLIESLDYNLPDDRHTKLETLRELLTESHPDEKIVVFSAFNEGLMPILERKMDEWGVGYVRYVGSPAQKQQAQDAFTDLPEYRVFLSSDMGSDSLNLEAGSVVIHYDLPWNWATKIQRQNRIHRISSQFESVIYYSLMMANSIEDRKAEVIEKKYGYHQAVFKGAIADQSASARMTREDLLYILGVSH
jgi:SNF2 family DNA or RNA helicase